MIEYIISSKSFVKKFQQNKQRVENRVNDYIVYPTEKSIHDVRTSIRRLDASFKLLPKKIRNSYDIRNCYDQYRQLFKINSEIRDIDIIYGRLIKYSSESIPNYRGYLQKLKNSRDKKYKDARKIASTLSVNLLAQITEDDISDNKLQLRYNKLVNKISNRIENLFPVVVTNSKKEKELHELRKDSKKLRYLLEILPTKNNRNLSNISDYLEEVQNNLGAIRDIDITIEYIKRIRPSIKDKYYTSMINTEEKERQDLYNKFVDKNKNHRNTYTRL
jgi:CHAD domain-containing protein